MPLPLEDLEDIPNFYQVAPHLYRGGQPTDRGLLRLKSEGIKTVISFRDEYRIIDLEAECLKVLGIQFESIPMSPFTEPSEEAVELFFSLVRDSRLHPIFVHCMHGQDRTGLMVSLYRLKVDGWNANEAFQEMLKFGFHPSFENLTEVFFRYASGNKLVSQDETVY